MKISLSSITTLLTPNLTHQHPKSPSRRNPSCGPAMTVMVIKNTLGCRRHLLTAASHFLHLQNNNKENRTFFAPHSVSFA